MEGAPEGGSGEAGTGGVDRSGRGRAQLEGAPEGGSGEAGTGGVDRSGGGTESGQETASRLPWATIIRSKKSAVRKLVRDA